MSRLLGIDYGTVRIGLALAEEDSLLARPFRTLDAKRGLMPALRKLIVDEDVTQVILGRPTRSMGEAGSLDRQILHFAGVIRGWGMTLHFQEEAFSSQRAELLLADRKALGVREGTSGGVDAVAAMIILQDWIKARGGRETEA